MQQPFSTTHTCPDAQPVQHGPDAAPTQHGPQAATTEFQARLTSSDPAQAARPPSFKAPPKAPPEEYRAALAAEQAAPCARPIQLGPHLVVWRGPRTRSDPAVGSCDEEGDVPLARGPRPHTLGLPGFDSPTGQRDLGKIWHQLAHTELQCHPRFEISTAVAGTRYILLWVMIWWMPQAEAGMLRPHTYHSTVARATAVDVVFGALREELDRIQQVLSYFLQQLIGPLPYKLGLTRPPWRSSWNFGIDPKSEHIALVIRSCSTIMLQRLPGVHISEHRPVHISWS